MLLAEVPPLIATAVEIIEHVRWVETTQIVVIEAKASGRCGRKLNIYEARAYDMAVRAVERWLRLAVDGVEPKLHGAQGEDDGEGADG